MRHWQRASQCLCGRSRAWRKQRNSCTRSSPLLLRGAKRVCEGYGFPKELYVPAEFRSEEHTSELQSLMRISYAVFCLKKTNDTINQRIYISLPYRDTTT